MWRFAWHKYCAQQTYEIITPNVCTVWIVLYHLWTTKTMKRNFYFHQIKLTSNDIRCFVCKRTKKQFTRYCVLWDTSSNSNGNEEKMKMGNRELVSSLCLPPTRVSCWLSLLTLHWLIQQHPQTKDWHELHSNQVQRWIHSVAPGSRGQQQQSTNAWKRQIDKEKNRVSKRKRQHTIRSE